MPRAIRLVRGTNEKERRLFSGEAAAGFGLGLGKSDCAWEGKRAREEERFARSCCSVQAGWLLDLGIWPIIGL